jgi:hypothetical protein
MGRSAIYLVMGTTTILLFFGTQMSSVSTEAMSNAMDYYESTQRYNIAEAGANMACNKLFLDDTWKDGFQNVDFDDGNINVTVEDSGVGKVLVTSIGTFQNASQTIKVLLQKSSFSKFTMYCGNVSSAAKFRDGDTINGPIHINDKLSTQGGPVFIGKATMGSLKATSGTPKFLGGYQQGVNIPFPDYTTYAANIKSLASSGGKFQNGGELWLKFLSNGDVQYKASSGAAWSAAMSLSTYAPNRNICINDGVLHVEGTLKGKVTLASTVTTSTAPTATKGATVIENNIRFATDPITTPSSTDMLGLVSAGDLTFQQIPIRVDGSYFTNQNATLNSSFRNSSPPGQLKVVGTFMAKDMNSTDFGTGSNKGANFYMKYDDRVEAMPPDNFPFPATSGFEILSWFE